MNRKKDLAHVLAFCRDCGWEDGDYIKAARKAYYHSKKTGHTVDVEQGYCYTIIGKKNETN